MAYNENKQISGLDALTIAAGDLLVGADITDSNRAKKATVAELDTFLSATTKTLTNKTITAPTVNTSLTTNYLTASELLITDGSKAIVSAPVATYPSLTELTYLKGVTSDIQTQIGTKQATITFGTGVETAIGVNVGSAGAFVTFNGAGGTPSSLVLTNATGLPEAGLSDNAVTLAKMAGGTDGNLITYDASGDPAFVATGDASQVLTSNGVGTAPTFQTPTAGSGPDFVFLSGAEGGAGISGYGTLAASPGGIVPFISLANGVTARAGFTFQIPTGYTGITSITIYALQNYASATLYFGGFNVWRFANDGTSNTTDSVTNQSITFGGATTGNERINTIVFPATAWDGLTFAAGETVSLQIRRSGADATDTYEADLLIAGIKVIFSV